MLKTPPPFLLALLFFRVLRGHLACETPRAHEFYLQYPLADHPVYDYLDRLETSEDVPLLSGTRPFLGWNYHPERLLESAMETRESRRYRNESLARMAAIGESRGDIEETNWIGLRRAVGIRDGVAPWLYRDGYHLASWFYDSTFTATIQPVYGLDIIHTGDARGNILRLTSGARVEGGYGQRLHYLVDFRDHTEHGNGPYYSRSQLYEDRWALVDLTGGSSTSYDISESFLQYYGKDLSVAAGRGIFRWGPGQFGSLFLNSNMPPFDYARFDAVIESKDGRQGIFYTFLHGWLESNIADTSLAAGVPGRSSRPLDTPKYMSAQRLELRPRPNLLLAFSQGVIYSDRGVQLSYLTPLNFLYSAQHANNDKDNLVLSVDGNWRPVRGVRLYGEVFFDDLSVSKLTTSAGGNKNAYTAGTQLMLPRDLWQHFDLRAEYTKIRPFVYSHVVASNRYTHWTSPLGYTLEPNSEFVTVELRGTFFPVQIALHADHQNHGSNGGDIYQPLTDNNSQAIYPFLSGQLTRTFRYGVRASCEVLPNLLLTAQGMQIEQTAESNRFETRGGFAWNF